MDVIAVDIGGTSIKSGRYAQGLLHDVRECPTDAHKGGAHRSSRGFRDMHRRGSR